MAKYRTRSRQLEELNYTDGESSIILFIKRRYSNMHKISTRHSRQSSYRHFPAITRLRFARHLRPIEVPCSFIIRHKKVLWHRNQPDCPKEQYEGDGFRRDRHEVFSDELGLVKAIRAILGISLTSSSLTLVGR